MEGEMNIVMVHSRWQKYSDRSWYFEVKPNADYPVWSYIGSVMHMPGNWLSRLLYPNRFCAIVLQGQNKMCRSMLEAMLWVEDNGVWP